MGTYCNGLCHGVRFGVTYVPYSRYVLPRGGKLCNSCHKGMYGHEGLFCPCCNLKLRVNRRIKRGINQEMLIRIE